MFDRFLDWLFPPPELEKWFARMAKACVQEAKEMAAAEYAAMEERIRAESEWVERELGDVEQRVIP